MLVNEHGQVTDSQAGPQIGSRLGLMTFDINIFGCSCFILSILRFLIRDFFPPFFPWFQTDDYNINMSIAKRLIIYFINLKKSFLDSVHFLSFFFSQPTKIKNKKT